MTVLVAITFSELFLCGMSTQLELGSVLDPSRVDCVHNALLVQCKELKRGRGLNSAEYIPLASSN
jgi:hypothetical protein